MTTQTNSATVYIRLNAITYIKYSGEVLKRCFPVHNAYRLKPVNHILYYLDFRSNYAEERLGMS